MAVACVLPAWSAGSARAAGALDGVAAATPAVTAQAPAPAAATTQQATTALRRAGEPVRKVARPAVVPAREVARTAVAAPQATVAAAPVPNAPVATVPRPGTAGATEPVVKGGVDAVSTAPVLKRSVDASTQPGGAAAVHTSRASRKAALGHARATAASAAAQRDADRRKQPTAGGFAGLSQIPAPTGLPQSVLLASGKTPSATTASGWRNRTVAAGTHRPQGEPGTVPVSGSGGATSVAAAASAAASAAGMLGLLLLLTVAAQRLGDVIRLRPDRAPLAPFLALHERPG